MKREEMEAVLNEQKANSEITEMLIKEQCSLVWNTFQNLVEAGFNEAQSLQIICARGLE